MDSTPRLQTIIRFIEDYVCDACDDTYNAAYDEAWDEARDKGFDEGFEAGRQAAFDSVMEMVDVSGIVFTPENKAQVSNLIENGGQMLVLSAYMNYLADQIESMK